MENESPVTLASDLRPADVHKVKTWLTDVWSGRVAAPTDVNWWVWLAETAESFARKTGDLVWAQIALSIYEYLHKSTDPNMWNTFLLSSLELRAHMIRKLGVVLSDPVLDPKFIVQTFLRGLRVTYEQASISLTSHKLSTFANRSEANPEAKNIETELSPENVVELQRIRDQLRELQVLADEGLISPSRELRDWLDLRAKLP